MKKRILSIVLAVLMLLSVLPTTALAAEGGASETPTTGHTSVVSAESGDKAVHVTKSVSGDGKTLTLEAYATNTMTTVTTYEPLDIVLVLDVSGSMDDPMGKSDSTKRIAALKTAVETFIGNVAKQKNGEKTVDHRISIVKFSGKKTDEIGNDTYREDGNTFNYSQIVKPLTAVSKNGAVDEKNVAELKNAVQNLNPAGATRADNGMKLAQKVLNDRGTTTRRSVVVLFTDGTPSTYSSFNSDVASAAISAANAMKAGGTKIYTIGVFSGAKPSDDPTNDRTSNENKYMHAMSSNYPSAAYTYYEGYFEWVWHPGEWKFELGTREKNSNYYLSATNSTELNKVFQSISGEIGSLKAKVDASSVLSDTLSGMFTFNPPAGADNSGIKVYKQPVKADGTDDVNNRTELTEKDGVKVKVDGKTLKVEGFDYGTNAVTANTDGSYKGYKLVVTIPIKPDTTYTRWEAGTHNYPTNSTVNDTEKDERAGLTYGNKEKPQHVLLDRSPEAPVTAYTVSYSYTGEVPTGKKAPEDDTAYIAGQEATVKAAPDSPVTESGYIYTFRGWTSDDKISNGKISITNHNVTVTGNWTKTALNATVTITKEFVAPEGVANFEVPTGLTLKLVPNDTSKDPIPLTQVEGESRYTASNVPAGTYTLVEENETVDGYTCHPTLMASGTTPDLNNDGTITVAAGGTYTYNLTNTYTENPTTATVVITKKLAGVPEGTSVPAGLEICLKKDGQTVVGPQTADTAGGDTFTITGLTAGTYEIVEKEYDIDGYDWKSSAPESFEIKAEDYGKTKNVELTNTYAEKGPDPISINVTKDWGTVDEALRQEVTVQLFDGENAVKDSSNKDVILPLNAENEWNGTFTNLPAGGNYNVKETKIGDTWFDGKTAETDDGTWTYRVTTTETGFKITNSFEAKQPDPVKKLNVTKTTDKRVYNVGEMITYTIEVENAGNVDLENITLTDTFGGTGKLYKDSNKETEVELTNGVFTESIGKLAVDESKTYTYYYWVQDEDGTSITNAAVATAEDDTEGGTEITTDIDRGDVDGYRVSGSVTKTVRSDKGTYNPDKERQEFDFVISADKDGNDVLDRFTIYFAQTVKEGKEKTDDGDFSFEISLNDYKDLDEETIDGETYKIVYLTEVPGDDDKMTYSTKPIKLYIVRNSGEPQIAALFGLNIIDGKDGNIMAVADPRTGEPANVTNIYNKKSEKPVKVGPQLNRDDHVAYIMGYPDGTVQPEGEITRAEACTIFFRLLTDSSRDYYFAKTNDYSDVNAGDWFNNAISTLSNAGIVTGYNDGTFRPNQPITRGEMAKIIANFANLKSGDKTFTDLAGHWSKTYVELAAGNGWIAGYPDGSFRPDQKITRAETVTMINRVLDRVPAKESRLLSRSIMLTFPDNKPGDWYYIAIQEASNSHEYQRSVYETTGDEMWTKLIDNVDWTKLEK